MVSINDEGFIEEFDVEKMIVGVIGHGYVGQAVDAFFSTECATLVYDKYPKGEESKYLNTLEDVIRNSHIVFVCVPTPMEPNGKCHTGIIESVLDDIEAMADRIGRSPDEFIVILKSTVNPGFTARMNDERPLRIVFSPEFLTEKNSIEDFENTNRIILGGDEDDARVVFKFFERKLYDRAVIVQCESSVAELCKLFANGLMATKVIFANEFKLVCDALGIGYDEVKLLATLDPRIADSHLNVPGPDGDLGFGGHCFIKDVNNLRYVANELGTKEKLFSGILNRNDEIRTDRDWERMKGRAVIDLEKKK